MSEQKLHHLDNSTTPKRILSLDGGGIRGILTLQFLDKIEKTLRRQTGREDMLLCDYFDLIGGTSTGSIIAAGLAYGLSVDTLKALYDTIGAEVFKPGFIPGGIFSPKFPAGPLQQALDRQFGAGLKLKDPALRTGLMIMTKRLDTSSPWPLTNHPKAAFAESDGELNLTQVVRASTAAPTYFTPEIMNISSPDGSVKEAAFVDGGVSPFNDPALQLLMLAALEGHGFKWRTGKDNLLLVSVGTGTYVEKTEARNIKGSIAAQQGITALKSLVDDCARVNQCLLQWLTHCETPWHIDLAVGDMRKDSENGPQLATYVRYNVRFEVDWMEKEFGKRYTPEQLKAIAAMDAPANMNTLKTLGQAAAEKQVHDRHFGAPFSL